MCRRPADLELSCERNAVNMQLTLFRLRLLLPTANYQPIQPRVLRGQPNGGENGRATQALAAMGTQTVIAVKLNRAEHDWQLLSDWNYSHNVAHASVNRLCGLIGSSELHTNKEWVRCDHACVIHSRPGWSAEQASEEGTYVRWK